MNNFFTSAQFSLLPFLSHPKNCIEIEKKPTRKQLNQCDTKCLSVAFIIFLAFFFDFRSPNFLVASVTKWSTEFIFIYLFFMCVSSACDKFNWLSAVVSHNFFALFRSNRICVYLLSSSFNDNDQWIGSNKRNEQKNRT